jgi:hypothetical protein
VVAVESKATRLPSPDTEAFVLDALPFEKGRFGPFPPQLGTMAITAIASRATRGSILSARNFVTVLLLNQAWTPPPFPKMAPSSR